MSGVLSDEERLALLLAEDEDEEVITFSSPKRPTSQARAEEDPLGVDPVDIEAILRAYGSQSEGQTSLPNEDDGSASALDAPLPPLPPADEDVGSEPSTGGRLGMGLQGWLGAAVSTTEGPRRMIREGIANLRRGEDQGQGEVPAEGGTPAAGKTLLGEGPAQLSNLAGSLLQSSSSFIQSSSTRLRDHIRSSVATQGEGGDGAGSGGLLSSFPSRFVGSFSADASQTSTSREDFPTEDFREVEDAGNISLWESLSQAHPVRSIEIRIRPDVLREQVVGLFETIVLSHGLVVTERGENDLAVERPGSTGRWHMVVLKMGVNAQKHRTLLVQFLADPKLKSLPSQVVSGASAQVPPTPGASTSLGTELIQSLGSALVEGKMTLSTLPRDEVGGGAPPVVEYILGAPECRLSV